VNEDVRLDDVGFPREEYCHCERCEERFADSEYDDWATWRESVITEFVAKARERIPGRLFLTLYPDPYPGHLSRRSGIDVDALEEHVDEFVVPIYDMAYTPRPTGSKSSRAGSGTASRRHSASNCTQSTSTWTT